jgi:hypothetical protein
MRSCGVGRKYSALNGGGWLFAGRERRSVVRPNVRAKLPAEACSVSLVCEGAEGAAHQAYAACRSGSA